MDLPNAIALTGGIATGKSSVCSLLSLYGFKIIDADKIAHAKLDESLPQIAERFGEQFVIGGRVDRKKLGGVIFSDEEARQDLEKLLHPMIREEIVAQSEVCEAKKIPYILDIPLFFEKGNYLIEEVAVVYCTPEQQIERLLQREGYTIEEAQSRIGAQLPIETKREKATFVIDNSADLKHLQRETERFLAYIKGRYPHLTI
ncbi:MAG TPA: dephospho-CoA kinase [Campylobacteraceae bacterium]|nr:dephospho-CoA kinase [Campylobacteraceae bacterium]